MTSHTPGLRPVVILHPPFFASRSPACGSFLGLTSFMFSSIRLCFPSDYTRSPDYVRSTSTLVVFGRCLRRGSNYLVSGLSQGGLIKPPVGFFFFFASCTSNTGREEIERGSTCSTNEIKCIIVVSRWRTPPGNRWQHGERCSPDRVLKSSGGSEMIMCCRVWNNRLVCWNNDTILIRAQPTERNECWKWILRVN